MSAFVSFRGFIRKNIFEHRGNPHVISKQRVVGARATLSSKARRRAADAARINTHLEIKRELDEKGQSLTSTFVSIPKFVRERCHLTHRTARVKIFLEKEYFSSLPCFRARLRDWLVRLFPELEQRGLLLASDDFDVRVVGSGLIQDTVGLQRGIEQCEETGSAVYVEVIPHNIPPPRLPLSPRVDAVAEKAKVSLADPAQKLLMVSFYKFIEIERPDVASNSLQRLWNRMGVRGRVYVAREGINAQLAVPEAVYNDFRDAMDGSWVERGNALVPSEIVGVFLNVDRSVLHGDQPFTKLHVRPREKILADGFDQPLDWDCAGEEISPAAWHEVLKEQSKDTVLLDCRNDYESSIGRFDGAEELKTKTFRETWAKLEKRLHHVDRGKRILTYCTGGIRCVKVNAFLEQKMGFKNTGRLEGGIVSYAKELRESGRMHDSIFRGVNHVFDGRMGEIITDDLLDRCINCDQPCGVQTDCANVACSRHFNTRIFVQCVDCTSRLDGACSDRCKAVLRRGTLPEPSHVNDVEARVSHQRSQHRSDDEIYADFFSSDEDALLRALRERTEEKFPARCRMMSSATQASLLAILIKISRSRVILEIGTFTGYASLVMARSLPEDGMLVTCERDKEVASIAKEYISKDSVHGGKVSIFEGKAMEYLEEAKTTGTLKFDLVFVDADKGGYEAYSRAILDSDLLMPEGIMIFDNVLFRGEVAKLWKHSVSGSQALSSSRDAPQARNIRQMQRTAKKLHAFNEYLKNEKRLEQVMLPFRDGLTIARRTSIR